VIDLANLDLRLGMSIALGLTAAIGAILQDALSNIAALAELGLDG
jgi:hypothetical protein